MAESLHISHGTKEEQYKALLPQLAELVKDEPDIIANMANVAAAIYETFQHLWVGFYRVIDNTLVLGPFQGPLACTRIKYGKGVCGKAWQDDRTIIVPNVNEFPNHIACSNLSQSEIVLPIHNSKGEITGVLDIDSALLNTFDNTDKIFLTQVTQLFEETTYNAQK